MTKDWKDTAMVVSALAMLGFAAILTTLGFFVPPLGEIHDSVLWVLGQAFMYAGGIFGVTAYTTRKMRKIQESVERDINNRFRAYEGRHRSDGIDDAEETDITDNTEETEDGD